MTSYEPDPAIIGTAWPACVHCHAARRLHIAGACPTAYRPGHLETATAALRVALERRDQAAIWVARGDVQRLAGHRLGDCKVDDSPLCYACALLVQA